MKTLLPWAFVLFSVVAIAQPQKSSVVIGTKTSKPNALLIVNPQHSDQGVLLPQLSTKQRTSMSPSSPSEDGLILFDTDEKSYFYWSNGQWLRMETARPVESSFYSIDPASLVGLKPDGNHRHNNHIVFESDNTFVTASREGEGEQVMAPINLPHGAVMEELTVFYMDNDDNNLTINLSRRSHSGKTEEILTWESSKSSASVRSESFTDFSSASAIDLENYTYRLLVVFNIGGGDDVTTPSEARQRLYGIRIRYHE